MFRDFFAMLRSGLILGVQGDEPVLQEVSFNTLDTADGGLLNSVRRLLSDIFLPALRASSHGWGELEGLQDASSIRQEFLSSLEGFVGILSGAQESLKEKVRGSSLKTQNIREMLFSHSLYSTMMEVLKVSVGKFSIVLGCDCGLI